MKTSWKTGISFGLTSGVITTLRLMVGLHSGTHSRAIVISGILTIAIADATSDALGIHVSEESKNSVPVSQVWEATLATFAATHRPVCRSDDACGRRLSERLRGRGVKGRLR